LVALLIVSTEYKRCLKTNFAFKVAASLTILLLLISLIMLQSRAGILGFVFLVIAWFLYFIIVERKYIIGVGILATLICIFFLVLMKFDRYTYTVKFLKSTAEVGITGQTKEDGTAIRVWIWKSALSAIEKHPILGIGPSNVREKLHDEYIKRDMKAASSMKLNAHNQFLETWLGLGIFGLFTLLAMLFAPLWIGIKKRDWLLVGFICLCSISFMFESMLETIAGIGFFAIFYTLLVSRLTNDQSEGKAAQKLHTT
jgi:O-antigen ligase